MQRTRRSAGRDAAGTESLKGMGAPADEAVPSPSEGPGAWGARGSSALAASTLMQWVFCPMCALVPSR